VSKLGRDMYHRLVHGRALIKFVVVKHHTVRTSQGKTSEYGRVLFLVPKEFVNKRVMVLIIPVSEILTNMPWHWLFGRAGSAEDIGEELSD